MKENSIEEDIKIALDKFSDNRDIDSAILIVEKFILGNYILLGGRGNIVKDSLRYILLDYKRVLKENEELKKFHIQDNKHLDFIMKNSITVQKENEELRKFILEGVTIEKSPYQNYRLDFLRENFIPIKEIKEKFKKINETKIDLNKINARDYMIFGNTEMATGWFINIDYIEKILLDVPGYKIESKLKK